MGCQCNNQKKEEENTELSQDNKDQKDEIFGLGNQAEIDPENLIEKNNENKNQLGFEKEDKNIKYADYPQKMLELINKIRENPNSYSDIIIQEIKNIIKTKIMQKKGKKKRMMKIIMIILTKVKKMIGVRIMKVNVKMKVKKKKLMLKKVHIQKNLIKKFVKETKVLEK